ncbi:MAG: hypothetical protein RL113_737 [Pseudomonadota bacterium]
MKRVEAATLEEAYEKAAHLLECSISELQYEVIQYPSNGLFGLLKKSAIIVATYQKQLKKIDHKSVPSPAVSETLTSHLQKSEELKVGREATIEHDVIVDSFFEVSTEESVVYKELALLIESQLKELFSHSCFDIDVIEVDVIDNTALIFIDGEDAALLIGKEGYRYNALSYMLFNWLYVKYELFIKLEIAEFLTTQQEMIRNYIKPVIENVKKFGKGKTRFLDGILVQIALEQLREAFPDKYVAVKTGKEGEKFVVINEFNHTKPDA